MDQNVPATPAGGGGSDPTKGSDRKRDCGP
jgi:hypothetical protein